jgi:hypothetical protein
VQPNQINMVKPCDTTHPGKGWRFDGAVFGTPVLAMESGTVLWVTTGNPLCVCHTDDPNFVACLQKNCPPNSIAIKSDVDGVVTEYVHIQPEVSANNRVTAGQRIATLAATGTFTFPSNSSPTPHVHINRLLNTQGSLCDHVFTCNYTIQGTNDPSISTPGQCPNGWSIINGEWVFCQNGARQGGWHNGYFADSNGVWAGFIRLANGNIQYRPRRFRTLPSGDPNALTVVKGDFACSLGQWWFFDNNGNLVSNNTVGWNPQTRQWVVGLQTGSPSHRLAPDGHCLDCGPSCKET